MFEYFFPMASFDFDCLYLNYLTRLVRIGDGLNRFSILPNFVVSGMRWKKIIVVLDS